MLNCIILLRAWLNYSHLTGSEEVSLSTNRLAAASQPLQSVHAELQRTGPVTKQKLLG